MSLKRDSDFMIPIALVGFADLVEHYGPDLALQARLFSDELRASHNTPLMQAVDELVFSTNSDFESFN
ncbi:hypothetical protein [Natrialba sp. PRR66]|uniref:hypothetical protein n=1 Tax=Natrialba sp. PRR66 TaxID=3098146 RepID=UPI002B1E20F6|nr:hypothetical protein [Natrialba sp. PRR66]